MTKARPKPPRPESTGFSIAARTGGLVAAAIISQIVNFGAVLAVAHIYGPEEVGLFGLFVAIYALAVSSATWRYEIAIVTVEDDREADDIVLLVLSIGVMSAIGCLVILAILEMLPDAAGVSGALPHALTGLPLALVATSANFTATNICSRQRRFGLAALQQVTIAIVTAAAQLSLAEIDIGVNRLVLGFLLGQAAGIIVSIRPLMISATNAATRPGTLRRIVGLARVHRYHAVLTVPYSLVTQLYYQLPLLMLGVFFTTTQVGYFSLAYRTTFVPITLIPTALAQVFFPEMARDKDQLEKWEPRLLAALISLGLVMAPAVALILAFGPDLYQFVLGENWRAAGMFAQIMIVANLINGLASGYDRVYFVLQRQRAALIVTCVVCALSAAMMLSARWIGGSASWMVAAWAVGHIVLATSWLTTIYRIAGFSLLALTKRLFSVIAIVATTSLALVLMPTTGLFTAALWIAALAVVYAFVFRSMFLRLKDAFAAKHDQHPAEG